MQYLGRIIDNPEIIEIVENRGKYCNYFWQNLKIRLTVTPENETVFTVDNKVVSEAEFFSYFEDSEIIPVENKLVSASLIDQYESLLRLFLFHRKHELDLRLLFRECTTRNLTPPDSMVYDGVDELLYLEWKSRLYYSRVIGSETSFFIVSETPMGPGKLSKKFPHPEYIQISVKEFYTVIHSIHENPLLNKHSYELNRNSEKPSLDC